MAGKDKDSVTSGVISTAPQPHSSRIEAQTPISVEAIREAVSPGALYWCGTLLMEGEFEIDVPANLNEIDSGTVSSDENGAYSKQMKTTAWNLWYPKDSDTASIFACRNRYYQQLDVTGLSFPAFSEKLGRNATNENQQHKEPWPGQVVILTDVALKRILKAVENTALRFSGKPWHQYPGGNIVNYMHNHMPKCPGGRLLTTPYCTECDRLEKDIPESNEKARPVRTGDPEYRRAGDLPISDYIYLLRLSAPVDTNPRMYPTLVPSMDEFILNQPPPLSRDLAKASEKAA